MPHVDEGQLHAYLDRGPGDATAPDWATFESHLAQCEDCRRKLEEARRVRDRAAEILAKAGPGRVETPPFESLVARSRARAAEPGGGPRGGGGSAAGGEPSDAPSPRRRPGRLPGAFPLAWAATIMVAVGAGWMARQVTMSSQEYGSLATRPAAEASAESAAGPATPAETEAMSREGLQSRLEAEADDGAELDQAAPLGEEAEVVLRVAERVEQPPPVAAKSVAVAEPEADERQREANLLGADAEQEAPADLAGEVARDVLAGRAGAEDRRGALAASVATCYALDVAWNRADAPPLPSQLELLAEAVPAGGDAFAYFADHGTVRAYRAGVDAQAHARQPHWRPTGPDSVLVRLPFDSGTVELRLVLAESGLTGVASTAELAAGGQVDADGGGRRVNAQNLANARADSTAATTGAVRARRIDCPAPDR